MRCGIDADEKVHCWDGPNWGEVDIAVPEGVFSDLSVGDSAACGLREDGALVCWGNHREIGEDEVRVWEPPLEAYADGRL